MIQQVAFVDTNGDDSITNTPLDTTACFAAATSGQPPEDASEAV